MSDVEDLEALDFEDTEESSEEEALPAPKYEIFSYPADTTLRGYLEQWNNSQLFIPEFQRAYVWDQTRASKLVESFLLGLPVPPVFLYKPTSSKAFWIIDGQQRIRSLVDFQRGIFGESKFRLKGVDDRWSGRTFDELTDEDRFSLETAVLRAVVIQQTNPADHSSIFHIFERLNTGGVRLNAMEVRQCVYVSPFLGRLKEWNSWRSWQAVLGLDKENKRLKDKELLLRVVALSSGFEAYEKPMKRFLNLCAIRHKLEFETKPESAGKNLDAVGLALRVAVDNVLEKLGPKPFHLRGRLNFSALDAVVATLMRVGAREDLKERFESLIKDKEFNDHVSFNTSDESVLKKRFEIAEAYLT